MGVKAIVAKEASTKLDDPKMGVHLHRGVDPYERGTCPPIFPW